MVPYSWLQLGKEQNVDIPVSGRGGRIAGLQVQGLSPGQISTALHSSEERISERTVEQIVDLPGGGLQDFRPGQSSSSSLHVPARVPEALDEPGEGFFFALFPNIKKSAASASSPSQRVPASVSPSTPAPQHRVRLWEWVMTLTDRGPYFWDRSTGETRWTMEDGYSPSWLLRPDGRYVRLGNGKIYETLDGL